MPWKILGESLRIIVGHIGWVKLAANNNKGSIMDHNYEIVKCRRCGSKNRIPAYRLREKAFCGKCHGVLHNDVHNYAVNGNDNNFREEVLNSSLPVFVDFWAPWCNPCRMVSPIIDVLAKKYSGRVKFVKMNVDDNPHTASQYMVRSIPSMLIFKDGNVIDTLIGARSKEELERLINSTL